MAKFILIKDINDFEITVNADKVVKIDGNTIFLEGQDNIIVSQDEKHKVISKLKDDEYLDQQKRIAEELRDIYELLRYRLH